MTSFYDIIVTASNSRTLPLLSTNVTVRIYVDDENDNRPKFNATLYEGRVTENATVGTVIARVFAEDIDKVYSIYITGLISRFFLEHFKIQCAVCHLSPTLVQLLFSFEQDMRVEKTLIQTLACQLSSTLMQLLFSFDQDMRVEKTLIQTLACQLSLILIQLLFSFDQDMRVEKTLIQTLACQLSSTLMQLLFSFEQDMRIEKTLIKTFGFCF